MEKGNGEEVLTNAESAQNETDSGLGLQEWLQYI